MYKRGPRAPKTRTGKPTRQKGRLLPIIDPERLAGEIEREIRERFAGDRTQAAAASGLSRIWLSRFLDSSKRARSVQRSVLERLERLFRADRRIVLLNCFYPEATSILLERYGEWLRDSLSSSSMGSGYWCEVDGSDASMARMRTDAEGFTQRDREREELWADVCIRFGEIAQQLKALSLERPSNPERMEIARRRVLDPLIEAPESGFVEAWWRHMREQDLRAVLVLGIEREEAMIGKEAPLERISNVLAGRPLFHRQRKRGKARGPKGAAVKWSEIIRASEGEPAR